MATLTPITTSRTGSRLDSVAVSAASGGDKWTNDGTQLFYINNAGSTITLTLVFGTNATVDGVTPTSPTVSVTGAKEFLIGPFPALIYNDASGFMNVTYSSVTSVTVAVFTPATT